MVSKKDSWVSRLPEMSACVGGGEAGVRKKRREEEEREGIEERERESSVTRRDGSGGSRIIEVGESE